MFRGRKRRGAQANRSKKGLTHTHGQQLAEWLSNNMATVRRGHTGRKCIRGGRRRERGGGGKSSREEAEDNPYNINVE